MDCQIEGRKGGRRKKLSQNKVQIAHDLYASKTHTVAEIYKTLGIGRTTFYRYMNPE